MGTRRFCHLSGSVVFTPEARLDNGETYESEVFITIAADLNSDGVKATETFTIGGQPRGEDIEGSRNLEYSKDGMYFSPNDIEPQNLRGADLEDPETRDYVMKMLDDRGQFERKLDIHDAEFLYSLVEALHGSHGWRSKKSLLQYTAMISKDNKAKAIALTQVGKDDVGSPQAQVSILTARIKEVTEHLKSNKHDNMARRGLIQMVGKRKRLLKYLETHDFDAYKATLDKLGLRK